MIQLAYYDTGLSTYVPIRTSNLSTTFNECIRIDLIIMKRCF